MKSYKDPAFQDRAASAAAAKQKALDQLRSKAPVDPAVVEERRAARLAREAAQAEKQAAKLAARQQAEAEKAAEALAKVKPAAPELTEAERKAARDARYAARKKRK